MGTLTDWLTAPRGATAGDFPAPAPANRGIESPWADDSILKVVTIAELWGGKSRPVTRELLQQVSPAVCRIRDLITGSCSQLPLYAVDSTGILAQQPLFIVQPEAGRARSTTILWMVDAMFYYGRAFWLVTQRVNGLPTQARWVPEWKAKVTDDGILTQAWGRKVTNQADVIRFDAPNEGILSRSAGLWNRLSRVTDSIDRQADNPVPSVELHQTTGDPLGDAEITKLIEGWAAARSGANGGVAYTSPGVEAKVHGVPAEQLMLGLLQRLDLETARACNVPAWAIDAAVSGSSITYSNAPSRARELIDYTLRGYLTAITDRLALDDILPFGVTASFSTDVLTNGDFGTRMADGKAAIDSGIYTVEQMQRRERGQL